MTINELLNQKPVSLDDYIDMQIDHIFQEAGKRKGELTLTKKEKNKKALFNFNF